jgi:hypothetical protein
MSKKISAASLFTLLMTPATINAQSIIDDPTGEPALDIRDLLNLILRLQDIVFAAAGGIAVAMIIWGAIVLITAGGNEERVGKGKKILTYSIGGIIFIVSAYTLITIFIRVLGGEVS